MAAESQHKYAHELLNLIEQGGVSQGLTYLSAAKHLGRPKPKNDGHFIGGVCDLIDAAARLAGVPRIALIAVKTARDKVNPKAWHRSPEKRKVVLARSEAHKFTRTDYKKVRDCLKELHPNGNKRAKEIVNDILGAERFEDSLSDNVGVSDRPLRRPNFSQFDALNDFAGFDYEPAAKTTTLASIYIRKHGPRKAVLKRARGICEYCKTGGFIQEHGGRYLETHHILHLKDQGSDSLDNLIALCPNDHREVHFGTIKRRKQMDGEMLEIIGALRKRR